MKQGPAEARSILAPLLVGGAMFWLNDFSFLLLDYRLWLVVDYLTRAVVIVLCLVAIRAEVHVFFRLPSKRCLLWTVGLISMGLVTETVLRGWLGYGGLFSYPPIIDRSWLLLDTIIGIPLVTLSEELLARGVLFVAMRQWGVNSRPVIIGCSALWFASFHWSLGSGGMAVAVIMGAAFMMSLLAVRSLMPALIAHYAMDMLLFALPQWHGGDW